MDSATNAFADSIHLLENKSPDKATYLLSELTAAQEQPIAENDRAFAEFCTNQIQHLQAQLESL